MSGYGPGTKPKRTKTVDARNLIPFETTEEIWANLAQKRIVRIDDTFFTKHVSNGDLAADFAKTEIHVSAVEVEANTLLVYLTSGTIKRRVRGVLRLPLGKIDLARAMAGARKANTK
jgi:hypothetical protein